jgi:hypothetical protein
LPVHIPSRGDMYNQKNSHEFLITLLHLIERKPIYNVHSENNTSLYGIGLRVNELNAESFEWLYH